MKTKKIEEIADLGINDTCGNCGHGHFVSGQVDLSGNWLLLQCGKCAEWCKCPVERPKIERMDVPE